MKRLLVYMKEYRLRAFLGPLFKLLEAVFELLIPLIVADIIDVGVASGDTGYVVRRVLLMIALGAVGFVSALTAQYFAARTAVGFCAKVRRALFLKVQSSSYSELDRLGASALITRMTGDVGILQTGVNIALRLLLRSPFIVFGALITAFTVHQGASLVFLGTIALLFAAVLLIMRVTVPGYQNVQKRLDGVVLRVRENLYGARVLRSFGKEEGEIASFEEANTAYYRTQRRVGGVASFLNPLTFALVNAGIVALLWISGAKVNAGSLRQGEVVALVNLMSQILVELVKLANMAVSINRALASARRISSVIFDGAAPETAFPEEKPRENAPFLCFDNVSFTYAGAAAESLSGVSFEAARGQSVGVIGPTGSGKSTLCSLIPAFYRATQGAVYLEGKNVSAVDPASLRRRIGCVPQKNALFHGTIRENLLLGGKEATDEELMRAVRAAQAEKTVEEKGGLDGKVEPNGRNFSGGQRQRLCIARALVGSPEILILDDSASALDFATEAALRRAIASLPQNPLVFLVSQRVSGVMHCDRILVMEDGRVKEAGTHEELLASSPLYAEICRAQLAGKEAAK